MDALKRYAELKKMRYAIEAEQKKLEPCIIEELVPFKVGDTITNGKIIAKATRITMQGLGANSWPVFYVDAAPLKADGKPSKKEIVIIPKHLDSWTRADDLFNWNDTAEYV